VKVNRRNIRWPIVLLVVAAVTVVLANSGLTQAQGSVPQQTSCKWTNIGTTTLKIFHVGSAMDTDTSMLYVYSGVDKDYSTENQAEVGDLSAATLKYTGKTLTAGGAMSVVGAACAYRAKGTGNDASAVWCFGGANDWVKGQGGNDVQRYNIKAGTWEKVSLTGLTSRFFSAAAYDSIHDAIWVVGGVSTCKLNDVLPPSSKACSTSNMATYYVTFDPTSGAPTLNTLASGEQRIYGQSLVFDLAGKRLLMHGGTTDIKIGSTTVKALDLADPDPAKAKWATVTTTGTAPQVYFHGAGFDASRNWMVVYGGVKKDFMQTSETDSKSTMALDFTQTPPKWTDLKPTGDPGFRVGLAMGYEPVHKVSVVVVGRGAFAIKSPGQATPTPEVPNVSVPAAVFALECSAVIPPTAKPTGVQPTGQPSGVPTGVQPTVPPTAVAGNACDFIKNKVPQAVINSGLSNPASVQGWDQFCYPSQPPSPYNGKRSWLSIQNPGVAYNPLYNGLIWKCGCP
jgi:hypothetical protein